MSLLPKNQSLEKQKFASFLEQKIKDDYSDITLDPLLCHLSLLPHLALIYNVNIRGLSEKETRKIIDLSVKNKNDIGTVQAVERAITFFLKEGTLVQSYEDTENLTAGQFSVRTENSNVRPFLENIKHFKNSRSKLVTISDGNCSPMLKLNRDCLNGSVINGADGALVKGVRVCFKTNKSEELTYSPSIASASVLHKVKALYLDDVMNGGFKYNSLVKTSYVTSLSVKNTIESFSLPRHWLGLWNGAASYAYSFSIDKVNQKISYIEISVKFYSQRDFQALQQLDFSASIGMQKSKTYFIELERTWLGSWIGDAKDSYTYLKGEKDA